jgi:hypothetical protein
MPLTAGPSERKNSCSKSKVFPYVGMIKKKKSNRARGWSNKLLRGRV